MIVNYDDLIRWPDQTIQAFYTQFGYPESPHMEQIIADAVDETRTYRSDHVYHYEQMGFSREEILREFADIFERFNFDRRDPDALPSQKPSPVPVFSAEIPLLGD